ncbi:MAG: lipopolysaccharide core heptose(I) kinase RfaP [Endozoicomonas sp. (ex Botrylloides leachii)]|nr:lipopolysaccharide core heptose(I) kinase RfaP [Endozoicomonas sp. (ex Botrylloides leachii)]
MALYLRDDFKKEWQGKDPYQLLNEMPGQVFRQLEARRTYRFQFQGKNFFAKVHYGVGWREIINNLLHFRLPVLGASNEWIALNKLQVLGIDSMEPVAYGKKGYNPAKQKSFLITAALENMSSLEEICDKWKRTPPSYSMKKAIIEKLAEISRTLHDNGINHRDYYFCHFLIPDSILIEYASNTKKRQPLRCYLIDLHRAQIRKKLPERWRLKDLSGLFFSSMEYGFNQRDIYRFIRSYTGLPLKKSLITHHNFWHNLDKKAQKLFNRMKRKAGHPNY